MTLPLFYVGCDISKATIDFVDGSSKIHTQIAISADRQPGARHLVELRDKISNGGIKCVFTEPQFKSKIASMITEGTKARTGTLDPLGASIKKGPELYFTLLRNNARAFLSCLGDR